MPRKKKQEPATDFMSRLPQYREALTKKMVVRKQETDSLKAASDPSKITYLLEQLTAKQRTVLDDTSDRISVRCPRRAGKTFACARLALITALQQPERQVLLIGLSAPSVVKLYWNALKRLDRQLELEATFNKQEHMMTLKNKSVIYFAGAKNEDQMEKLRGLGEDLHVAIIEECKSFPPHVLREVIEEVLEPALDDNRGRLILVGTPGDIPDGPFFEATYWPQEPFTTDDGVVTYNCYPATELLPAGCERIWSFHSWSRADNTAMPHLWKDALRRKAKKGWTDDNETWRREYLGEWVLNPAALVFRVYERHLVDAPVITDRTIYVLGMDFGSVDATTAVVIGYDQYLGTVTEVYTEAIHSPSIDDIADLVRRATAATPGHISYYVGDPGGTAEILMQTLRMSHGWNFEQAKKHDKVSALKLLNADFDDRKIYLLRDSPLYAEMRAHRWNETEREKGRWVESDDTPNDMSDAFVYAYRKARHHARLADAPEMSIDEAAAQEARWRAAYHARRRQAEFEAGLPKIPAPPKDSDWWG